MRDSFVARIACLLVGCLLLSMSRSEAAKKLPTVPSGFTIEIAAGSPLVKHPMLAGFDERGRLYIAESAGQNIGAGDLVKNPPNFIRRLEDTDGDGRFDKSTIFADKMTLPMGALWHRGALYVASPPNIWRLRDFDDDGVADERKILVNSFGFSGNAASVHGCFLGPNGRLYWCDGRHGHEFKGKDGQLLSKGKAARIFSCRLDGSDVQTWCGGGMDNPVEVDFLPGGEMVGSVNIFRGRPRVDSLVHWMDGGAYPRFDQACVSEFPKTGKLLPLMSNLGHVAVSGMTRYRSTQFGVDFQNNLFTTLFNTHRVVRSIVKPSGATFRTVEKDFLVSDDPDFHPTDVFEDADGSLLVIDTGGWFRIGCPVSKVAKPDIHGTIYRIRRRGAHQVKDPRGRFLDAPRLTPAALTRHLDDPRPAVRERVIDRLALADLDAVEALVDVGRPARAASETARVNAIWALSRIDREPARVELRRALSDPSAGVRAAVARSLGTLRDEPAVPRLIDRLKNDERPAVRRQAATALGRISEQGHTGMPFPLRKQVVSTLLRAVSRSGVDRFEEHALLYAAIRINDRSATIPLLTAQRPGVRRAALVVLDQMADGRLTRDEVIPLLDTDDPDLQQVALAVIGRHEGWASQTRGLLEGWLSGTRVSDDRRSVIRGFLLAQQADADVQALVSERLDDPQLEITARRLLLDVLRRSSLSPLPERWATSLTTALGHKDSTVRDIAVRTLAERRRVVPGLAAVADGIAQPAAVRVAAMSAFAGRSVAKPRFVFLMKQLDLEVAPLDRLAAARVLASGKLDLRQQRGVAGRLAGAGPLELPVLLRACTDVDKEPVASDVLRGLEASASIDSVGHDELGAVLRRMPERIKQRSEKLVRRLLAGLQQRETELKKMFGLLEGGDVARGRVVFFGKKAACSGCHRVKGQGARVGPELSAIGDVRQPRDLLESVVLPSATFARGFRSYTVVTTAGRVHTGIISRETTDAIWLKTADLVEVRVARVQVEVIKESSTSIMPKGLDKTLSPQELRDLLAFLMNQRRDARKVSTAP